jgi:hypothetical protein
MSMTRGSRRALVAVASALVMLAVTAAAAGALHRQTDCDERPQGIGCDRSTTTSPNDEAEQTSTTKPAGPTTRKGDAGTSLPSANGATAGAQGELPPDGQAAEDQPVEEPVADQSEPARAADDAEAPDPVLPDADGASTLFLAVAVLFGLGAGAAAGAALMASRLRNAGGPTAVPAPAPAAAVDDRPNDVTAADLAAVDADRTRLVRELIEVRDQVGSEALRTSIGAALADVGVVEQSVAPGVVFDPQLHKGVDRVVTDDPGLDRTVSETERPGYLDRGAPVRLPEVIVHRLEAPEAAS